jgi:hypothetical protein
VIYAVFMSARIEYLAAKTMPVSKTLLFMLVCLCAVGPSPQAYAATLYVDIQNPSASDTNSGALSQPWLTIQKAASTAIAGDTVIVKAGEYNEFFTFQHSGTALDPIVFQGERGTNGEWLAIIDPSTSVSSGWVSAPEIGSGVYKKTGIAFETHELTIDHKRVAFVYTNGIMSGAIDDAYYNSGLTTGTQFLALPSNTVLTSALTRRSITFWDGVEALYATANTNTTYLRLRDGSDPNGLNIRVAPNKDGYRTADLIHPALIFDGRSYITLRNFHVRGAFGCMRILEAAAHHNVIESNYLSGGSCRVLIGSGAHDNVIRNNELTADYYGYHDPGAWGSGSESRFAIRENLYLVSKFLMGVSASFDNSVNLASAGSSNAICGNHIYKSLGTGINISGAIASPTSATDIYSNIVANHPSVGIHLTYGHTGTRVHGNLIADCNSNVRFHAMNYAGETNRIVYVYRNRLWLPANVGDHMFAHFYDGGGSYRPECWVYHNSFSGGKTGFAVGIAVANYDTQDVSNMRFLNNVFSDVRLWVGNIGLGFMTNASMLGVFDYNVLTPPVLAYPTTNAPAWFGAHNLRQQAAEWQSSVAPAFELSRSSFAINAAIDVSQPFVIGGITYAALPAAGEERDGHAWDIGALEYYAALQPPSDLHTVDPADSASPSLP